MSFWPSSCRVQLKYPFSWLERQHKEYLPEDPRVLTAEGRPSTGRVFELEEQRFNRCVVVKRLIVVDQKADIIHLYVRWVSFVLLVLLGNDSAHYTQHCVLLTRPTR